MFVGISCRCSILGVLQTVEENARSVRCVFWSDVCETKRRANYQLMENNEQLEEKKKS